MKTCSTCKTEKPFTDFYKRKNPHRDSYRSDCIGCHALKAANRVNTLEGWEAARALKISSKAAHEAIHGRVCCACKATKPTTEFYPRSDRPTGLMARCKPCSLTYQKGMRDTNPDRQKLYSRKAAIKSHFGLSLEDFDTMLSRQNGTCAGCLTPAGNLYRRMDIDHCHKTGKIRGLLCPECNMALGKAKDNPTTLRNLAAYLESHL